MAAGIGYGTLLKCGADAAASTVTITLGGVRNITPPGFTRATADVTHNASPGMTKEFIAGLIEIGDLTFELIWDPNAATTTEILQTQGETGGRLYEISWPQFSPVPSCTFRGILTGYQPDAPTEEGMMASITIKPMGALTWASV